MVQVRERDLKGEGLAVERCSEEMVAEGEMRTCFGCCAGSEGFGVMRVRRVLKMDLVVAGYV